MLLIDALDAVLPPPQERGDGSGAASPFVDWAHAQCAKRHRVLETQVELPADEVVDSLFGRSAPVAEAARLHSGTADYLETPWLSSEAEAAKALRLLAHLVPGTPQPANPASSPGSGLVGRVRMNLSSTRNFGKQVFSFERERCLEAALDGPYRLEICVASTALMGERFRCLFLHSVTAMEARTSRWAVDFALVFVEKTNVLLRKSIETGAHSAVKRNFEAMARLLREYAADKAQAAEGKGEATSSTVFVAA